MTKIGLARMMLEDLAEDLLQAVRCYLGQHHDCYEVVMPITQHIVGGKTIRYWKCGTCDRSISEEVYKKRASVFELERASENERNNDNGMGKALIRYGKASHPKIGGN